MGSLVLQGARADGSNGDLAWCACGLVPRIAKPQTHFENHVSELPFWVVRSGKKQVGRIRVRERLYLSDSEQVGDVAFSQAAASGKNSSMILYPLLP